MCQSKFKSFIRVTQCIAEGESLLRLIYYYFTDLIRFSELSTFHFYRTSFVYTDHITYYKAISSSLCLCPREERGKQIPDMIKNKDFE